MLTDGRSKTSRSWKRFGLVGIVIALGCGDGGHGTSHTGDPQTVEFAAPMHLRVDDVDVGAPRVAASRPGTWLTVWGTPVGISVARSTDGGEHWGAPIVVAEAEGIDPGLACDRAGACIVVWKAVSPSDQEHDVYAARSTDAGATWSAPVRLSRPGVFEGFAPRIATDGGGTWMATWDAADGSVSVPSLGGLVSVEVAISRDAGETWEAPTRPHAGGTDQYAPRIAADAAGRWVMVWVATVGPGNRPDQSLALFSSSSTDGGRTWAAPVRIVAAELTDRPPHETNPDLVTDGQGTWHVVWVAQRPDEIAGGAYFEIHTARSSDHGASWSPPQMLDVPRASTVDLFPRLAAAADGRVVALWLSSLEANRMALLEVQSADRGASWSLPAALPGSEANPLFDGFPEVDLATDDDGAWTAVWSLATPGLPSIFELHDVVVARGATVPEAVER